MHTTAIGSHIRRCNRNLLTISSLSLIGLWIVAVLWGLSWTGFVIVAGVSGVLIRNIVVALRRGSDITLHPLAQYLARYGPPAEVAQQIDRELTQATTFGEVKLSRSWLLAPSLLGVRAVHLLDVMWVYKQVMRHAPDPEAGSAFRAIIHAREGPAIAVALTEETINGFLTQLTDHAPWAIGGYDAELAQAWRDDRPGFIAAVDGRREEV